IADSSIMPRITTGNTMAPCVVIGERAAECEVPTITLQRRKRLSRRASLAVACRFIIVRPFESFIM
ncbi:hypothetical protein ACCS78_33335, partial [Rhizobium johnstonii]